MEAIAKLNGLRISPRKVRLVADMVRGMNVAYSLVVLKHNNKKASEGIQKLVRSAVANWEQKNQTEDIAKTSLLIKEIRVDSDGMLKRIMPAPQGRGHRIRKRSSRVTIIVDKQIDVAPTVKKSDELKKQNIK